MTIQEQLLEDMKQAMRDKNSVKLGVIRFIRSEIKNYEIDNGAQDDAGVQKVISALLKKLKDAMTEFQAAGRDDLVAEETEKIGYMEAYLPEQLSDEALAEIVAQVKAESQEENMGKLIGLVNKKVAGQADGSRVAAQVKALLQ